MTERARPRTASSNACWSTQCSTSTRCARCLQGPQLLRLATVVQYPQPLELVLSAHGAACRSSCYTYGLRCGSACGAGGLGPGWPQLGCTRRIETAQNVWRRQFRHQFALGLSSCSLSCSTNCMRAVAVTAFVTDGSQKTVSSDMAGPYAASRLQNDPS